MSVSKCVCTPTIHIYNPTSYLPSPHFPAVRAGVNPFLITPAPAPARVLILVCARGVVAATSACVPGVRSENSSGIGRFREEPSGDGLDASELGWV
jgi:hypothetical protein